MRELRLQGNRQSHRRASMKLKYEVGTRYADSETYDEATDKVVHGWQVFRQCRPDGTPTGRESFVNHHGILCGLSIAESQRHDAITASAHELLESLKEIVKHTWPAHSGHGKAILERAVNAIEKADGIQA